MSCKTSRESQEQKAARMTEFDMQYGAEYVCGVDEAGRGPLAGPVAVCACIMPQQPILYGIDDSKKLSEQKRELLYEEITQIATYSVVLIDRQTIDEINILNATKLGMKQAVENLAVTPRHVIVDAVKGLDISVPYSSVIKADAKSYAVAAASILAKVTRDRLMRELDKTYPAYGFSRNKGYGTAEHIAAIKAFGACPEHRLTFIKNFTGAENKSGAVGE